MWCVQHIVRACIGSTIPLLNSAPFPLPSVGSNNGALLLLFSDGETERWPVLDSALNGAWPPTVTSGLSERYNDCIHIILFAQVYMYVG